MKIYINAFEGVCAVGRNQKEILENIACCHSGISLQKIQGKDYRLAKIPALEALPSSLAKKYQIRTNAILYHVILMLKRFYEDFCSKYKKERIGVIIGTTTSGTEENYQTLGQVDSDLFFERNWLGNPSEFVAKVLDAKGLCFGISSACTSGAKALVEAARLLEADLCDVVICGGVDSLNTLTIKGFESLEILSTESCKPFSRNRNGINIGEGAALFVLSKEKVDSSIVLKGFCVNNDAFHITKPNEDFQMQELAILDALKMANLQSQEIDYIDLHGTGTFANDKMEASLIHEIFPHTLCSSTKAIMGHTLGAAGALEALVCAGVLVESRNSHTFVPPHCYDGIYDDSLKAIALAKRGERIRIKNTLSLSFAFGGDNCALILGEDNEDL